MYIYFLKGLEHQNVPILIDNILAVLQGGGPSWEVLLGRRDGLNASQALANTSLPSPFATLDQLIDNFAAQGLDTTDLVTLSGTHNQIHIC